jgi:nucleotide-binding universal stress UspA family protein
VTTRGKDVAIFNHILVPTDFGETSQHALDVAVELATAFNAELTLTHTWELPPYGYAGMAFSVVDLLTPVEQAAQEQLDQALVALRHRVPRATTVLRRGRPWEEILSVIELRHVDLVVMGTHGRRGLDHAFLGSVAEKIVRMSPVPVLTVRGSAA